MTTTRLENIVTDANDYTLDELLGDFFGADDIAAEETTIAMEKIVEDNIAAEDNIAEAYTNICDVDTPYNIAKGDTIAKNIIVDNKPRKPFYHESITSFKNDNHVRIDHVGMPDGNRCFNIKNNDYRGLISELIEYFGEDLYLNEVPDGVRHRVFFDFDINLSEFVLESIIETLKSLIVVPAGDVPEVSVLRNEKSGKVHIIINVSTITHKCVKGMPENNISRRAEMRYLRKVLYQDVKDEIDEEDWFNNDPAIFDVRAPGIRSAYSIKVDSGEVKSRDRYLPVEIAALAEVNTDTILKYSIYRPAYGRWNDKVRACIEAEERVVEDEIADRKAAKKERLLASAYDINTKKLLVIGTNVDVTQSLIDKFISLLSADFAAGYKWTIALLNIRACGQLVPNFDPDYFLHTWSIEHCATEYNKGGNNRKYYNAKDVTIEEAGVALTWLRDKAVWANKPEILKFISPIPNIFDVNHHVYFADYLKCCRHFDNKLEMQKIAGQFIRDTTAYIVNGGNGMYVTKNRVDGQCVYEIGRRIDKLQDVLRYTDMKKPITFSKFVLTMHAEICYDRVDFIPHAPGRRDNVPAGIFNIFTEFAAHPAPTVDFAIIEPAINHIRDVLCAGDSNVYKYVINWLAHLIQHPNKKMGTALLFKSSQGAGKNIVWDYITKHIIGRRWATTVNDVDQIICRFNSCLENKILTICDEIQNYGGAYKANDKLKSLITQDVQKIERKGVDTVDMNDFNHYVFLTNNDWPIRIEASDRRYVTIECNDARIGDFDYFSRLAAVLSAENAGVFMSWLLSIDLSAWNPRSIPTTKLKQDMKMNSIAAPIQWLISILKGESEKIKFGVGAFLPTAVMYQYFKDWCGVSGIKDNGGFTERMFALQINKISKSKKCRIDNKTCMAITLDFEVLRQAVAAYVKIPADELIEIQNDDNNNDSNNVETDMNI